MKRLGYIVQIAAVVGFVVNSALGLAGVTVLEVFEAGVSAVALFFVGRALRIQAEKAERKL